MIRAEGSVFSGEPGDHGCAVSRNMIDTAALAVLHGGAADGDLHGAVRLDFISVPVVDGDVIHNHTHHFLFLAEHGVDHFAGMIR